MFLLWYKLILFVQIDSNVSNAHITECNRKTIVYNWVRVENN